MLGFVQVPAHCIRAPNDDFTDAATWHLTAIVVDDLDFHRPGGATTGAQHAGSGGRRGVLSRAEQRNNGRHLRLAISLEQLQLRQHGLQAPQRLLLNGRSAIHQVLQGGQVVIAHLGMIDQQLNHGRHQHGHLNAVTLNRRHRFGRLERRQYDVRRAFEHTDITGGHVRKMEHRCCAQHD
ncbi:hypothetical protein D3C87_1395130 [compost metagenome]